MRRRTLAVSAAVPLIALAAACSSSSTTTVHTPPPPKTGTETISAAISGKTAAANLNSNSSAPLSFGTATLTGPVAATITPFTLTGNGNKGTVTWTTSAGPITVVHTAAPGSPPANSNTPPPATWTKSGNICHFVANFSAGTFSAATGSFSDITSWTGNYKVTAIGNAPLASGKTTCSFPNVDNVETSGASVTFNATGPITVKS